MYPASAKLLSLSKVFFSVGTMYTLFAGSLMLRWSLDTVVAGVVLPVGSPNNLVDISLVARNRSVGFPALDMAPVSLIADGMIPYIIPCISSAFESSLSRRLCFWCAFYQGRRLVLILVALLWRHVLPSVYQCAVGRLKVTVFGFVLVFVGELWARYSTGLRSRVQ